jgi:hypothetical protein
MEKKNNLRHGVVSFEKRKYPRIDVDLPIEYGISEPSIKQGRVVNASEGGLLLYLPERMEIGQHLVVKLFFSSDTKLETLQALVQVVWIDLLYMKSDWGDYRTGVMFVDISPDGLNKLKNFLISISG